MENGYAWIMWKSRMASAFRTGWACVMVGFAIEYYKMRLHKPMDFQPFAYLTATLIVGEACLGEAVQGAALALYGTLQGACPALLSLWLMGPSSLSAWTIMLVVTVSGFLVSLPKSTHIVTKRVALGQIVIVYVAAFMHREKHLDASVFPLHAALSTAVGAAASVLALLVPVPRLACLKIGEKIVLIEEISFRMLKLLTGAYSAESMSSANAFLFQARTLGDARAHLISTVRSTQTNIGWEEPLVGFLVPKYKALMKKFLSLERPIKGMEIALSSCPSFPMSRQMGDKGIKDLLNVMAERISSSIETIVNTEPKDSSQVHVDETQPPKISLDALEAVAPASSSDLPPFFFIFCMKNLYESVMLHLKGEEKTKKMTENEDPIKKGNGGWYLKIDAKSLLMAVKCSISLGLSVLFGIIFTKDNGYWGGLAVAVSIASQRESTFKMANMRAQGTVLGSVYGVVGCFLTQRFEFLRYIALIPWAIFTSFIRQSEMFGYAGGVTAFIGAVVILGRRNYGSPSQFAIERITETFIGILCCIFVEFIFLPRRASTLAREKLLETVAEIGDAMPSLGCTTKPCLSLSEMKESRIRLRTHLSELKNLMEEAKSEPDFWFVPFPNVSYSQVWGSLSTVVELLDFLLDAIDSLLQVSCTHMMSHSEIYKAINEDLEEFQNYIDSYLVCFQDALQVRSLKELTEEYRKKIEGVGDLEVGGVQTVDGEDMDKIVESFVRHIGEAVTLVEGKKEMRGQMVVALGAIGFCMSNIMKETQKIELGIQEILQKKNPLAHVNLWEIHHMVMQVRPS